jgi:hypothetical protein
LFRGRSPRKINFSNSFLNKSKNKENTMLNGLRQKTVVQSGGVVAIQSSDLPCGATVEVIVLVESPPQSSPELSLTDLIGTAKGSFKTPEEADQFIRQERDSWEF